MPPLNVLIVGSGIAGPSLAFWLSKSGHKCTIIERFPSLRAKGAQIDLREGGIEVVRRMGLLQNIWSKCVEEDGVAMVNERNEPQATIMANKSGQGAQGPTSEYEIMRGDLVQILFDATKDKVNYIFGITMESFEQDELGVDVKFSDGTAQRYDILVGADGQGSRVRKAILPPHSPDPLRRFGCYLSYWIVPRTPIDNQIRKTYIAPGRRTIMCRSHSPEETQAYFWLVDQDPALRSLPRASTEEQMAFLEQRFKGVGWQTERFLHEMRTTENFYCQELVHVRLDSWSKGRVVLLGDAAYCASPMSGMGTTVSLMGAYILAGEIASQTGGLDKAFQQYEDNLRPVINLVQEEKPKALRLLFYETWWGIRIFHIIMKIMMWLQLPKIIGRFSKGRDGGFELPNYSFEEKDQ